jgi:hypothetical protein
MTFDMSEVQTSRREVLLKMICENELPEIHNCSGAADQTLFTMGDLEALEWMTKRYTHDSEDEVDGWERTYYGPNPIVVITSGEKEPKIISYGEDIE